MENHSQPCGGRFVPPPPLPALNLWVGVGGVAAPLGLLSSLAGCSRAHLRAHPPSSPSLPLPPPGLLSAQAAHPAQRPHGEFESRGERIPPSCGGCPGNGPQGFVSDSVLSLSNTSFFFHSLKGSSGDLGDRARGCEGISAALCPWKGPSLLFIFSAPFN